MGHKEDRSQQGTQGITFEVKSDDECGVYSNAAAIAHSKNEFILDFAMIVPGKKTAPVQARIVTNPEHAKQFMMALQENIQNYERIFGEIQVTQPFPKVKTDIVH